jgi:Alpha-L-arabinofuranosidase B, catalytic
VKASILFSAATVFLAFAGCTTTSPGGGSQTGGITASGGHDEAGGGAGGAGASTGGGGSISSGGTSTTGGATGVGGAVSSGGVAAKGGATSNGGSGASGGTNLTGGGVGSGGSQGGGGTTARGGAIGSGGATVSGGTTGNGGGGGADAALPSYQGPCDVLGNGCAEAYSLARAMTASYTGPLFQLGKASDAKAATLDVGQTSDHKADMTTWSAYCGGSQSNCVVSKIYAQIHKGSNDLLPGVWNTPWKPDCSAGGYTCAAKFTIESATGLPILTTVSPQEYALSGDNYATGINGGSKAMGIMYNGKPVANQVYCCGVIGLTHKYNASDTTGTDFMLALAYGWKDSGGCCIATNCGASNKYCVGAEEEENNDLYDYGTSPLDNAMVVTQFDPTPNAVITYLNGTQVMSHSPPKAKLNAGTAIHLGGGGDLSQPDPVLMREALFTNNVMSASEVKAMMANVQAVFPSLKFP